MTSHTKQIGTGVAGSKAIITGEHAVVHGGRAIVLGMTPGIAARVSFAPDATGRLTVPQWQWDIPLKTLALETSALGTSANDDDNATTPMMRALEAIWRALDIPRDVPVDIAVDAAIPSRAGLGASASMATAVSRALADFWRLPGDGRRIDAAVAAAETVFHQTPSGIDAAAVRRPGLFAFRRGQPIAPIDAKAPPLAIFHTHTPGNTAHTVARFAAVCEQRPAEARERLRRIDALTDAAERALTGADWSALGDCLDENHAILRWFGVSTPRLDELCRVAKEHGAWGAKLTGGGGGGCALVLADPADDDLFAALRRAGFSEVLRHA
ncbi:MAG: mevalonate kinase [Myxococcales bacterium]|jgi:hydroxymethylglutaryl-CoA reductase|nr:mevalonate kinase [Myxococcales bacterium]